MDKGNLIRKYESIIKRDYIVEIIRRFERVRELLFYKGELDKVVDGYLNYDRLINDYQKQIIQFNRDIKKLESLKFELLNKSVIELRKEGKLIEWLNNLNDNELNEIKNIVDVEGEFRKIDDYRFNESKKNRGKMVIQY